MAEFYTSNILCLLNFLIYLERSKTSGFATELMAALHVDAGSFENTEKFFLFGCMASAALVAGPLRDRCSRRKLLFVATLAWIVPWLLKTLDKESYILFSIARFLSGGCNAVAIIIPPTIMYDMYTDNERALALFYFNMSGYWGSALGSVLILVPGSSETFQTYYYIALLLFTFLIMNTAFNDPEEVAAYYLPWKVELKSLLSNKPFLIFAFMNGCMSYFIGIFAWWGSKAAAIDPSCDRIISKIGTPSLDVAAALGAWAGFRLGTFVQSSVNYGRLKNIDCIFFAMALLSSAACICISGVTAEVYCVSTLVLISLGQGVNLLNRNVVNELATYSTTRKQRYMAEAVVLFINCVGYFIGNLHVGGETKNLEKMSTFASPLLSFVAVGICLVILVAVAVLYTSMDTHRLPLVERDRDD